MAHLLKWVRNCLLAPALWTMPAVFDTVDVAIDVAAAFSARQPIRYQVLWRNMNTGELKVWGPLLPEKTARFILKLIRFYVWMADVQADRDRFINVDMVAEGDIQ